MTPAKTHPDTPPADASDSTIVYGPLLGVDPGLQRTGYAVLTRGSRLLDVRVLEAGVIRLDPRQPIESRLLDIERGLEEIIRTHKPVTMACEQLYAHYKHPRTAIIMAHARGVILAVAARRGLSIINIAATHVKKHLTGSGRAGKVQIQRAVAATLNLPTLPEPNDVADAIAVGICGLQMQPESLQDSGSPHAAPQTAEGDCPPCSGRPPSRPKNTASPQPVPQTAEGGCSPCSGRAPHRPTTGCEPVSKMRVSQETADEDAR